MRSGLVALERATAVPMIELLGRVLEITVALLLLLSGLGLFAVCLLHFLVLSLESALLIRRLQRHQTLSGNISRKGLKIILLRSLPLMLSLAAFTALLQAPPLAAKALGVNYFELAAVTIALQIASTALTIPVALGDSFIAGFSRARKQGNNSDLGMITLLLKLAMILGAGVALVLLVFGDMFILVALGARYDSVMPILTAMAWALPGLASVYLGLQFLNSQGQRVIALISPAVPLLVFLGVVLVFGGRASVMPSNPTALAQAYSIASLVGCASTITLLLLRGFICRHECVSLIASLGLVYMLATYFLVPHSLPSGALAAVFLGLTLLGSSLLFRVFRITDVRNVLTKFR